MGIGSWLMAGAIFTNECLEFLIRLCSMYSLPPVSAWPAACICKVVKLLGEAWPANFSRGRNLILLWNYHQRVLQSQTARFREIMYNNSALLTSAPYIHWLNRTEEALAGHWFLPGSSWELHPGSGSGEVRFLELKGNVRGFALFWSGSAVKCGKLRQGGRRCITLRAYLAHALDGSVKLLSYLKGVFFCQYCRCSGSFPGVESNLQPC